MHDDLRTLLDAEPFCREILISYAEEGESPAGQEGPGWQSRRPHAEESPAEIAAAWSNAHGLLIAHGLLDIDLVDRAVGMQYRLTRDGRELATQLKTSAENTSAAQSTGSDAGSESDARSEPESVDAAA